MARGHTITVNELYRRLQGLTGTTVDAVYESSRPGDVKHSFADISQARSVLGFSPEIGLDEGLELTVEWFRAQG